MSPNMDPIYLIKDIPCGDPFDKRNGGDWIAAPSRGGPAWETGQRELARLVDSVSGIFAS